MDTSEGQVYLAVNHRSNLTNVYVSDVTGTKFTLTLDNVYDAPEVFWRLGRPYVDFYKVNSMLGTYIANKASPRSRILPSYTLITYDAGGSWRRLKAPSVDRNGNSTRCSLPTCSLHLSMSFGRLLGYDSLVSSKSAPGLIVATGNYGKSISFFRRNTFVSVDGGITWKEAQDPYRDYIIQDYGSLIVSSGNSLQINKTYIQYSCDSGLNWKKLLIANHSLYIVNLLTEPGQKTLVTTVAGTVLVNRTRQWIIVRLNFTALLPRMCKASDYFNWSASDPFSGKNKCLLGQKQTFRIRKQDSCCYNGKYFQPFTQRTSCVCTREDFQCNYGFQPVSTGNCTIIAVDQSACDDGSSNFTTAKYRKVPSDKCKGGVEKGMLKLYTFPCKGDALTPIPPRRKPTNLGLYVGLPVGILAFGIVLWVFYRYGNPNRSSPYTRLARLAGDDDGEGPSDDDGAERVIASTRSAFKADDFDDDELLGSKSNIGPTTPANA
ncbi:uncharacterized protein TRIADDRAFT_64119 [Trichoplax adhaerens]|uniref:VPS10 domain-containing protein n=1 Tax=Trichoplax adhaerens TaxID=10228 RepID=B3S340_TRIAD|nr:hypothetical protein TRIADDRAFT_64119 [Trichoplax adhaerens]EDV22902.1 hypothetical protein TRIADDRAFT_64119 [Trichoplax adhaerens]|eukprot:XP_002114768.1 hypothetical protein TRIADDRAFT_64119 [Trichoplax adhaerens]